MHGEATGPVDGQAGAAGDERQGKAAVRRAHVHGEEGGGGEQLRAAGLPDTRSARHVRPEQFSYLLFLFEMVK